ncbi:histidine biosynthesis bifunctional hisB domain protein, partial [Vibrio parahaemolyticus V-223/04]
RHTT